MTEVEVSRNTATEYLNGLVKTRLIDKVKIGKTHYYMNIPLMNLFLSVSDNKSAENIPPIESVSELV